MAGCVLWAAWWWVRPPDPGEVLRQSYAPLAGVERMPAPHLGSRIERWRLVTVRGDTLVALYRPAFVREGPPPWTVVLLGGLGTGERAALVVPESLAANVLALDWPWRGPRRMGAMELLRAAPAIRRALHSTPGALATAMEAAAIQPDIDPARVALVGASLGVPPAVAALRLSSRPRALVLLHGGADLHRLLRHALGPELRSPVVAAPAAALGGRLLHALEPERHAGLAAHLPVLVINATGDERIPPECIESLHAALPGAEVRWQTGAHMRPQDSAGVAIEVASWLGQLPSSAAQSAGSHDEPGGSWRRAPAGAR